MIAAAALLPEYNTRIALLGAGFLGAAAGLVGTFLVLRRRALMADTLGHSTLPGIAIAFVLLAAIGLPPRSLPPLLVGAAISAGIAAWLVTLIRRLPRMRDDAALAIVLGVLFGVGLTIMGVIQQLGTGEAAGLDAFIDGNVASMRAQDAWTMVLLAVLASMMTVAMFKELTLVAFDPELARLHGLPVRLLEFAQLALAVLVTVAGLRAVGLILIIALLVIPPAAARYWSDRLPVVAALAAAFGAVSGLTGAWISSVAQGLSTGPLIVLAAAAIFVVSLIRRPKRSPTVEVS